MFCKHFPMRFWQSKCISNLAKKSIFLQVPKQRESYWKIGCACHRHQKCTPNNRRSLYFRSFLTLNWKVGREFLQVFFTEWQWCKLERCDLDLFFPHCLEASVSYVAKNEDMKIENVVVKLAKRIQPSGTNFHATVVAKYSLTLIKFPEAISFFCNIHFFFLVDLGVQSIRGCG